VTDESTYEVTVRYVSDRDDDVYVIDKGDHPEIETTDERELWISRDNVDVDTEQLVAVYARGVWACAWVKEIPPPEDRPQDTEYRP